MNNISATHIGSNVLLIQTRRQRGISTGIAYELPARGFWYAHMQACAFLPSAAACPVHPQPVSVELRGSALGARAVECGPSAEPHVQAKETSVLNISEGALRVNVSFHRSRYYR